MEVVEENLASKLTEGKPIPRVEKITLEPSANTETSEERTVENVQRIKKMTKRKQLFCH